MRREHFTEPPQEVVESATELTLAEEEQYLAYHAGLDSESVGRLKEKLVETKAEREAPEMKWPRWPQMIKGIAEQEGGVEFIGYGSLLNAESAKGTLGEHGRKDPVIAYGAARTLNFALEERDYERYERSDDPNHRGSLNVLWTGEATDLVNGLVMHLTPEQIDSFADRERGYHVAPVLYSPEPGSKELKRAFMLVPERDCEEFGDLIETNILPNESYLMTCIKGAASFGSKFLETWLDNCYLADGAPLRGSAFYEKFTEEYGDPEQLVEPTIH